MTSQLITFDIYMDQEFKARRSRHILKVIKLNKDNKTDKFRMCPKCLVIYSTKHNKHQKFYLKPTKSPQFYAFTD